MRVFTLDIEEFTKNANVIKEEVLKALERDGLLKKSAVEIGEDYAVVISEPGWFGKMFHKLKGEDKAALRIYVMKAV